MSYEPQGISVFPTQFRGTRLNLLGKLTSKTPDYQPKLTDSIYPDHTYSIHEAGLEP